MAHEIEDEDTMFSHRELPWHGLGTVVDTAPTSAEAIGLAGLDYQVEKVPVFAQTMSTDVSRSPQNFEDGGSGVVRIPNYHAVEGGYATIIQDADKVQILGLVGEQYEVVQNRESFAFLDQLVSDGDLVYETAGSMRNRAHTFMCAKLPGEVKVAGEELDIYIVCSNFHDGSGALRIDVTPVRVVCKNTQRAAFGQAKTSWRMRHTTSINDRLDEARKTLELTRNYQEEFVRIMEALALESLTREDAIGTLDQVWPSKGQLEVSMDASAVLVNLERSPTIPDDMRNTKYGLFNAATEYLDWRQEFRRSSTMTEAEQRFGRLGKNEGVKGKLLAALTA